MAFIPSRPSNPSGMPPSSGGGNSGKPPFQRPNRFQQGSKHDSYNKDDPRMNERIRVPQVRLIDENGEQVGVVPTSQALQMARDRGLDLMEVSPNAHPPVCKILDFGKFKYEKKKKEHAAKKKQVVMKVKEVQLRPRTDEHDREYKFRSVREFLKEGDKAKITIMFRGREVTHTSQGYEMMNELIELVKDIATVESPPKLEGKKMIMILAPGAKKATTTPTASPITLKPSTNK